MYSLNALVLVVACSLIGEFKLHRKLVLMNSLSHPDSITASQCCPKGKSYLDINQSFLNRFVVLEVEYEFLETVTLSNCDGKDAGNYTLVKQFTRDSRCSLESNKVEDSVKLLSCDKAKQTNVNALQILATQ